MSAGLGKSVCIAGCGALGLVATKNFLEAGFDVEVYERNDYVGGLWHATLDPNQTSVLANTKSNVSKYGTCYTDFPFPDDVQLHPTAKEVQQYLESYANHFDLNKHVHLSTTIVSIQRDGKAKKWLVTTRSTGSTDNTSQTKAFDRLIIATGPHKVPIWPVIRGKEGFRGDIIHSREFKDPTPYKGKRVVIMGTGSTSADTIECLRLAGADKIYMSHRRSFYLIPRKSNGKALDAARSRRLALIGSWLKALSPWLATRFLQSFVTKIQMEAWPRLRDHAAFAASRGLPSVNSNVPCVSDDLARNLLDGTAESVQAVDHVCGPHSIRLKDGRELHDIDAIICSTGTRFDFSLIPHEFDPNNPALAPDHFSALKATKHYHDAIQAPRTYRSLISLQEPHSLAFLGHSIYIRGALPLNDLISMAIAQLWRGAYPMPSRTEMGKQCDAHYRLLCALLDKGNVCATGLSTNMEYDQWLQKVAGTGVWERLGWGFQGWKFWWTDRKLYKLLMDGVDSSHALRLFDGGREGRKTWPSAREAIEKANREIEADVEEWKKEKAAKKSA